jgi:hypothetical protein
LSFTGGDEDTAAAKNRGGGNGEWGCSSACGGVLRVQRGAQELERELKKQHREGGEGRREDPEWRRLPFVEGETEGGLW